MGGPSRARLVSGYGSGRRGGHPAPRTDCATVAPAPLGRTLTVGHGVGQAHCSPLSSAELFGEPDEESAGPADVAEPIHVLVLHHLAADELCASLGEPRERLV